jgi:predicted CXXCH cytochrome family protein
MAEPKTGKFQITRAGADPASLDVSGITLGRLASCDVVLDHSSVSRIHAGINYLNGKYFLINLSASNVLTLNGRLLAAQNSDQLADGDIIQIGPFIVDVRAAGGKLGIGVREQIKGEYRAEAAASPDVSASPDADVLQVFWEKRTREKEEVGTRLRPVGKPEPGKAVIKWKPTGDLRGTWRKGVFIWIILIFGAFAVLAFWRFPQTLARKPLANPHTKSIESSMIAARGNGKSCATCHAPDETVETACISCHQAEGFHASNTVEHEQAGITCTQCHTEHQGENFPLKQAALQSCAQCHNDDNKRAFNGKTLHTPHGGAFGYPAADGKWIWRGLHTEIAETIPALALARVKDEGEQALISREFHTAHVGRLAAPAGMKADSRGRVSCSTCHKSFDPIDREMPRQTCASCHSDSETTLEKGEVNCVSCHVQHPFSSTRWDSFLSPEARDARKTAVDAQIGKLNGEK